MQSLEIISVNIWQLLISLCNLLILYLMLKRVLFRTVKGMIAKREQAVASKYDAADKAKAEAEYDKSLWQSKMNNAEAEAAELVEKAQSRAEQKSEEIIASANERAALIIRRAEEDALLEKRKAEKDIKTQIIDISTALAEKLLSREINPKDHRDMINSFLDEVSGGEVTGNEGSK